MCDKKQFQNTGLYYPKKCLLILLKAHGLLCAGIFYLQKFPSEILVRGGGEVVLFWREEVTS